MLAIILIILSLFILFMFMFINKHSFVNFFKNIAMQLEKGFIILVRWSSKNLIVLLSTTLVLFILKLNLYNLTPDIVIFNVSDNYDPEKAFINRTFFILSIIFVSFFYSLIYLIVDFFYKDCIENFLDDNPRFVFYSLFLWYSVILFLLCSAWDVSFLGLLLFEFFVVIFIVFFTHPKVKSFIIDYHDPIIIGIIILFFMWKFIFFPDFFEFLYEIIKSILK